MSETLPTSGRGAPSPPALPVGSETWEPTVNITMARRLGEIATQVLTQERFSTVIESRDGKRKRHIRQEGWTFLGALAGPIYGGQLSASVQWCRRIEGGWEACVVAHTLDGREVARAEQQCTAAETRWKNADDYARRGMAQTRATGRAMRLALGWVLALTAIDYSTVPPEDADDSDHQEDDE